MSESNPYENFSNYVLRTPLYSYDSFKKLTSKEEICENDFRKVWDNPIIKEALFLASPALTEEIEKWLNNEINDEKRQNKLKYTFLKYISRMSSRCTPFGLFAGCSLGSFESETHIELDKPDNNSRHTRLDMNYLVALAQSLMENEGIRNQVLFYPNSSLYNVGDKLRYVEYTYYNGKRQHQIVEVDNSEYLEVILLKAVNGKSISTLSKSLIQYEIDVEDVFIFIEELIANQLLVSELEPVVSGPEFLEQICNVLRKLNGTEIILNTLEKANQSIANSDNFLGNNLQQYIDISNSLKSLKTDFDIKFMFQTDMFTNVKVNKIDEKIISDLKKGFSFLNKITIASKEGRLEKFRDAFYERFEEREVPLSTALDLEIGVGYKQNDRTGDVNPLVDDLVFSQNDVKHNEVNIKWNSLHTFFQSRIIDAVKEKLYTITFTDEDFKRYEANWDDLPDTFSSIIQIIKENDVQKIKFSGGGGSSSANLLSRFCYGSQSIKNYTEEMIKIEANMNRDKILAEIVHLPESRVGNILAHPDFRSYEIPYLAKSIKTNDKVLSIEDLMISVKNRTKILLRSKKYNKEVLPRLTNAHNYSYNSLPIYNLLADLQTQGIRSGIGIDLGPFTNDYEFIPRIEYNNLILHDATWNLKKKHIKPLLESIYDNIQLFKAIGMLRERLKIPQFVMLSDGDNELLVNFKNLTSVRMLLDIVSKRNNFKLVEFLFNKKSIVNNEYGCFTNQIIISFFNKEKLKKNDK